jgi:hypothetical protein
VPLVDNDRRRLVEAIAYSPEVSPADRLRAVQLLQILDPSPSASQIDYDDDQISDAQLDEQLDALLIVDIVQACLTDQDVLGVSARNFPLTRAFLTSELDRRVEERVQARMESQKSR